MSDIFNVKTEKGVITFERLANQLYVFKPTINHVESLFINTLEKNKGFYTKREIERAQAARNFSRAIGCPSDNDLKAIIRMSSVKDCPIIEKDVTLAEKIFGKDAAVLKGKTTCKKPEIVIHDTISIPPELKLAQQDVTLCVDGFYVNKMMFLHTISENILIEQCNGFPIGKQRLTGMLLKSSSNFIYEQAFALHLYMQMANSIPSSKQ